MDVRCERCRAQYVFDDDQVTQAGLTVQCTNCGHLFKVRKKELIVTVPVKPGDFEGTPMPANAGQRAGGTKAAVPSARPGTSQGVPAAAPARPATSQGVHAAAPLTPPAQEPEERGRDREWRVRQANGNIFTFREMTTLQKWIIEQKVSRDDQISLLGDQWKRLGNIPELASFFQVVEAAERSKLQQLQPGITPMPNLTPMPMPALTPLPLYPTGSFQPPPPPTPSTSWANSLPGTSGAYPIPTGSAPILPPPVHEVDLGMDIDEPPPPQRSSRAWLAVLGAAVLAGGGAGAYFTLFAATPPPPPPPPPPQVEQVEVPITIAVKPAEPPPAPVPAPEPVVEPPKLESPAPPKGPKALLAKAHALLEKGDPEAALTLFGKVASQDPSNVEALAGRGLCYLDLESYPPAEASFDAALRLDPEDADAMLGIAESYRNQGKKAEATAAYERYLARHPGGEDAEVAKSALEQLRK